MFKGALEMSVPCRDFQLLENLHFNTHNVNSSLGRKANFF